MLKKTIKYTDFNGNEREEDFYFNYSSAEIMEKNGIAENGLYEVLREVLLSNNNEALLKVFKELILGAYGEKSADGKRFIKSKEISEEFSQTAAYSELFMELIGDSDAMWNFVLGTLPNNIRDRLKDVDRDGIDIETIKNGSMQDVATAIGLPEANKQ